MDEPKKKKLTAVWRVALPPVFVAAGIALSTEWPLIYAAFCRVPG